MLGRSNFSGGSLLSISPSGHKMRIALVTYYHPDEMMGGAEYQSMVLAQNLARQGWDVSFIATFSSGEGEFNEGGVSYLNVPGRHVIGPSAHFRRLTDALARFGPDVCYVRVFEELDFLAEICRSQGIPFVSASSHARETSPILITGDVNHAISHFRSFFSLRYSSTHVCNTRALERKIRRWYPRLKTRTIHNGHPKPQLEKARNTTLGRIIWVNNLKSWKRPGVLVRLAAHLPQYQFVMVGRMGNGRFGTKMKTLLSDAPPNLTYSGPKPIEQVNSMIEQSDLLILTSKPVEGFPNSLIQAWLRCTPTVSLSFDPDGIIERERIGRCSRDFDHLVRNVDELMLDAEQRLEIGLRAREFACRHLTSDRMTANYSGLFEEVLQKGQMAQTS